MFPIGLIPGLIVAAYACFVLGRRLRPDALICIHGELWKDPIGDLGTWVSYMYSYGMVMKDGRD